MKFSSVIKVENNNASTDISNDNYDSIETALNKYVPIIINGLYSDSEFLDITHKLENTICIEVKFIQIFIY